MFDSAVLHAVSAGCFESPVNAVRAILERPDEELDYARAKIAFDRLVDPSVDEDWVLAELERLTECARQLAGRAPNDPKKLEAVRTVIYDSGPWNGERPFEYDHSDPFGIPNKLLRNYLATGLGQCVSMPTLFLILAERLRLNVALSTAPHHVLVRYTNAQGRAFNIEATSGANPARDEWVRRSFRVSERGIETGIYLRTLTKREGIVVLAHVVTEHLWKTERWSELVPLCKLLFRHRARDVDAMLTLGSAYGKLADHLRQRHPTPWTMPPLQRARLYGCIERNMSLFAAAEALGWNPTEEEN